MSSFLTAILVVLIGAWVTLYVRRKNVSEGNINKFTTIFSEFIHILQTKGALFADIKMKEFIKQHEMAAIELRISLNCWGVKKFNRYWKQYKNKADQYYNAPAQLGYPKTNKEMIDIVTKLIKKVKRL